MSTITLLTDFGLKDGNVGVMKGVIWGITPDLHIADLSHYISPQNVPEAALVLRRAAPYFPDGTVHVVVVDPGVGTERRPIAAQLGTHYFVGPDNGVVTMQLEHIEAEGLTISFIHLNKPQYWLPMVSSVFHGRDIFAPAAAHLASGVTLTELGDPIDDPIRLSMPKPVRTENGYHGQVIHLDHFGNISTNIRREHLAGKTVQNVHLCGVDTGAMVVTFGERPSGELVALFGSTGNLIVSVVNGNAAHHLDAQVGDLVEVFLKG
jgi:S-adenosylmethionine hydrolase